MQKKNILILCGGGGPEHEVSLVSAKFFAEVLAPAERYVLHRVQMQAGRKMRHHSDQFCDLSTNGTLSLEDGSTVNLDFIIPVVHGSPGESGELPALFGLMLVPYLGCRHEASVLSFNKVSTKLWLQTLDIPVVPFIYLAKVGEEIEKAAEFLAQHDSIYVKASSQGSSVGCYRVDSLQQLQTSVTSAFELSPYVLLEKEVIGRELEVSVYEYDGAIQASYPGEIICPDGFYTYEEKYQSKSKTETRTRAEGISDAQAEQIRVYAKRAFEGLNLRHLARIDFFLSDAGQIYINEINTFPGHTEISMFPTMLKENGHNYYKFLCDIIEANTGS